MLVLVPRIKEDGSIAVWKPMKDSDHMIKQVENGYVDNVFSLVSKRQVRNKSHKGYLPKPDDRPVLPSIKNFVLVSSSNGTLGGY